MINALRFTEELEKVGFSPEQAKKSVDTWMSLINENFATKSDMREFQLVNKAELREVQVELQTDMRQMKVEIEGQIKDLRTDLQGQIKDLKSDLLIKLGGLIAALFAIGIGIISILIIKY